MPTEKMGSRLQRTSGNPENGRDGWKHYGISRTDAPAKFHELIACGLVATAIDRNRHLRLRHKDVYPSIFGIAIAPSGRRKSTPFGYGEAVALSAFPDRVLGNDYSPEALLSDLATEIEREGKPPVQSRDASRGVLFIDEAGRLLTTMRRSGYGEGLKDVFSMVWDCPEERSRKLQKAEYTLESVYVNLLMATTDTRFAETLNPEDITSGFLARFLPMVAGEEISRKPLARREEGVDSAEQNLTVALRNMRARLAERPGPVEITDAALKRLDQAERDLAAWASGQYHSDLIDPWARRIAEYGGRLAIIFAVSEGQDLVDLPQVLRAIRVLEQAKEDVLMLVDELTKGQAVRELDRIERFIRANPGITFRDLQRRTSKTAGQLKPLLQELASQGRIVGRGERPQRLYAVTQPVSPSVVSSVSQEVSVNGSRLEPQAPRQHPTDTTDTPTHDTSGPSGKSAGGTGIPTGDSIPELRDILLNHGDNPR